MTATRAHGSSKERFSTPQDLCKDLIRGYYTKMHGTEHEVLETAIDNLRYIYIFDLFKS